MISFPPTFSAAFHRAVWAMQGVEDIAAIKKMTENAVEMEQVAERLRLLVSQVSKGQARATDLHWVDCEAIGCQGLGQAPPSTRQRRRTSGMTSVWPSSLSFPGSLGFATGIVPQSPVPAPEA